jgi:hypothetical protein
MATKQELVDALRAFAQRAEEVAAGLSPDDWNKTTYEQGWSVKQAFCHLAGTSAAAPFMISLAANPRPPSGGTGGDGGTAAAFDVDAWNAREVANREGKPIEEILTEVKTGHENSIKAVQAASDELLAKEFRAPWGLVAPLGDVLLEMVNGHDGGHLDDIEQVLR